jgi:hypothetical protein
MLDIDRERHGAVGLDLLSGREAGSRRWRRLAAVIAAIVFNLLLPAGGLVLLRR